jgi:hypothetical protein
MFKKKEKVVLTIEQETEVLHFIQYCQGHSMRGDCRNHMYDIYTMFKNDGRNSGSCTCLDGDTAKKVDNFITSYTFSDEIRFTERFHSLLPHLAFIREEAKKPLEEVSSVQLESIDITELNKKLKKVSKMKGDSKIQSRKTHGKAKDV